MDNNLVRRNIEYFNNEILPYKFLIYTMHNEVIVVDVVPENLAHLLGINRSSNIAFSKMSGKVFYEYCKTHKVYLFELISEERFNDNDLTKHEKFLLEKNLCFIDLFETLIQNPHLIQYIKTATDDLDTDYLHMNLSLGHYAYLGIIGSCLNHFHYFNSVMYEPNTKDIRGTSLMVKKVVKVKHADFVWKNYKIKQSRRNEKKKKRLANKNSIDVKQLSKLIQMNSSFILKTGRYKKNSIQLYKNNVEVEKNLLPVLILKFSEEAVLDAIKTKNVTDIVAFINEKYVSML